MKRNRQQRYSATVYRMVPLYCEKVVGEFTKDNIGVPYELEGDLQGYLVVSVPVGTSHATAKMLRDELQLTLNKSILIVTHNVEFMAARKLSPKEAAKVIKKMEEAIYAEPNKEDPSTEAGTGPASDGDRPGVCPNGGSDTGVVSGCPVTDTDSGDGTQDPESRPKDPEEPKNIS